jgi:uncharacterized protein YuzE
MAMHLSYDGDTDVAYLSLRATGPTDVMGPALILETDGRLFPHLVIADYVLGDGGLVGFEFHDASACLPAELLATAERMDGQNATRRFGERIARLLEHGKPEPGPARKH